MIIVIPIIPKDMSIPRGGPKIIDGRTPTTKKNRMVPTIPHFLLPPSLFRGRE